MSSPLRSTPWPKSAKRNKVTNQKPRQTHPPHPPRMTRNHLIQGSYNLPTRRKQASKRLLSPQPLHSHQTLLHQARWPYCWGRGNTTPRPSGFTGCSIWWQPSFGYSAPNRSWPDSSNMRKYPLRSNLLMPALPLSQHGFSCVYSPSHSSTYQPSADIFLTNAPSFSHSIHHQFTPFTIIKCTVEPEQTAETLALHCGTGDTT